MYCGPCYHRNRQRIDSQIIDRVPYRTILAENPDLSLGALSRHKSHIREALAEAMSIRAGESAERGSALADRVESLLDEAKGILSTAKTKENLTAAIAAVNACTRLLELVGRLDGTLQASNSGGIHFHASKTVNINANVDDELALAELLREATSDWNPVVIEHFKQLTPPSTGTDTVIAPGRTNAL